MMSSPKPWSIMDQEMLDRLKELTEIYQKNK